MQSIKINPVGHLVGSPSDRNFYPDLLYLENPTHPVGSPLSTQPAWWVTNVGPDVPSCICTPATVAGMPEYWTWTIGVQANQQTQSCLASEDWYPRIQNPNNFSHKPVPQKSISIYTGIDQVCTNMYWVRTGIYMHIMEYYRYTPHHATTVEHGGQGRVANPSLTGQVEITVRKCRTLHVMLIVRHIRQSCRARMHIDFLEEGLICLQVASPTSQAWKWRMHMNTSLLFVRFTTLFIFLIWACWKNQFISEHSIYWVCTSMYQYVLITNKYINLYKFIPLELDKRCCLSFPTARFHWPCAECCVPSQIPLSLLACLVRQVFL